MIVVEEMVSLREAWEVVEKHIVASSEPKAVYSMLEIQHDLLKLPRTLMHQSREDGEA